MTGTLAFSETFLLGYYEEKVGVWSTGTVLYIMLRGQMSDPNVPRGKMYNMREPIGKKVIDKMMLKKQCESTREMSE